MIIALYIVCNVNTRCRGKMAEIIEHDGTPVVVGSRDKYYPYLRIRANPRKLKEALQEHERTAEAGSPAYRRDGDRAEEGGRNSGRLF